MWWSIHTGVRFPAIWEHGLPKLIATDIKMRHSPIVDDLCGKHDSIRGTVLIAAEGLEGGMLLEDAHEGPGLLNADVVLEEVHRRYGPVVDDIWDKHNSIPGATHLAAHVELRLLAAVAAEGLEGGVLLEHAHKVLGLVNADVVQEEIHRR
jgi:hypothetical protein